MIGTHVREMYTEENKSNHHRITKDHHSSCHLSEYTPQKFPCRLLMWPHKNNLDCCLHCSEQQGDNGVPPPPASRELCCSCCCITGHVCHSFIVSLQARQAEGAPCSPATGHYTQILASPGLVSPRVDGLLLNAEMKKKSHQ